MNIGDLLKNRKTEPAPHELATMVNMIEKDIGFKGKYGRGYWLKKVKDSGVSYGDMHAILKDLGTMNPKYPKGPVLTKILCRIITNTL